MSAALVLNTPTIITLPEPGAVDELTRRARKAMLEFCNGALFWDKRGLARWLVDSYAPLVKSVEADPSALPNLVLPDAIEPRLMQVVTEARQSLVGALRLSRDGRSAAACAWKMIREGVLAPCEDPTGAANATRGWMPIAQPRMRLRDRVLSLWAVDFLANDQCYASELVFCSRCGLVEFDAISRARGTCRAHKATSGIPGWIAESETQIRIKQSG